MPDGIAPWTKSKRTEIWGGGHLQKSAVKFEFELVAQWRSGTCTDLNLQKMYSDQTNSRTSSHFSMIISKNHDICDENDSKTFPTLELHRNEIDDTFFFIVFSFFNLLEDQLLNLKINPELAPVHSPAFSRQF